MFTILLALIEANFGIVFHDLYLGTFLIDIALIVSIEAMFLALIVSIEAMFLAEVKYRNTNEVEE